MLMNTAAEKTAVESLHVSRSYLIQIIDSILGKCSLWNDTTCLHYLLNTPHLHIVLHKLSDSPKITVINSMRYAAMFYFANKCTRFLALKDSGSSSTWNLIWISLTSYFCIAITCAVLTWIYQMNRVSPRTYQHSWSFKVEERWTHHRFWSHNQYF